MTCIIGYADKENDCTWIGGDSLGSNGFTKDVQTPSKVFRNKVFKNVVMGSTSTFRHIDLLKYSDKLFDEIDMYKNTELNHEYMVTKFIPKLITLFKDGVVSYPEQGRGANFIIGAGNKIFEIQGDYSVLEPTLGFTAVGCGEYTAMGSLTTTKNMDISIPERITLALESAEECCCGVQRPFVIMNTKDEEVIVIE
ncbi:hypothetical protein [Anaerovorax sp. IOR16]|uniref:hypothetical protein n=1 Tax=Anaerovorax sp. IOR16 TaxID=2773458 RepID=UPI0019D297C5|nr:hypothetical protein [Anaerovorax sp. IOR16]